MFTRKPRLQLEKFAINGAKDFYNTIPHLKPDIARRGWHGRKVPTAVFAAVRQTGLMEYCAASRITPA